MNVTPKDVLDRLEEKAKPGGDWQLLCGHPYVRWSVEFSDLAKRYIVGLLYGRLDHRDGEGKVVDGGTIVRQIPYVESTKDFWKDVEMARDEIYAEFVEAVKMPDKDSVRVASDCLEDNGFSREAALMKRAAELFPK